VTGLSPNLRGILLMTLSMALLAAGDTGIKLFSGGYRPEFLLLVVGAGSTVIFAAAALARGERLFDRAALRGAPLARSVGEVLAGGSMIYALAIVPFTIITLMMQAMPLIVTAGAVVFFHEYVGPRRWAAIAAGMVGVLVILRPWGAEFELQWLLAVAVVVILSARDLTSRAVPPTISTVLVAAWGGVAATLAGLVLTLWADAAVSIPVAHWPGFFAIIVCLAGGVATVTAAMRTGDVAVVAPFRYLRLPMGLVIGVTLFGETVDAAMISGAAIIVVSGLYIFFRERNG